MQVSLTDQVCEFAAGLRYEDLPQEVVDKVKIHLLDTLACAVGGESLAASQMARIAARSIGATGQCFVFGDSSGLSAPAAAFANAAIGNALDYDDGVEVDGKGLGHPGATLVAAALAGVDTYPTSGQALVTALAAGYEVNNRLIAAIQPTAGRFLEVYGVGQHQAIGAAIVYGLIAGLDAAQLHNALGLAGTLTSVPSLHKYNWQSRPVVSLKDGVAPAAMSGVYAVILSKAGFVGSRNVFDGPHGYWRMLGSDQFDEWRFLRGLGEEWWTLQSSLKAYPACRWVAPALEATEYLLESNAILPGQIDTVHVETFGKIAEDLMHRRPAEETDAQFSLPYLIGALAMRLPKGAAWFSPEALSSPVIQGIADSVSVSVDREMDRLMSGANRRPSARVTVRTRTGQQYTHHISAPSGSRSRPLPPTFAVEKAMSNLHSTPDPEGFVRSVMELEHLGRVNSKTWTGTRVVAPASADVANPKPAPLPAH